MAWYWQGGGSGIPEVANWPALASLEPAIEGLERILASSPGNISGRSLARRGASNWTIPGCDAAGLAYLQANPIPLPEVGPFYRDSAILSPGGMNIYTTTGDTAAFTIPMHLFAGVSIGSIELGGWNTQGAAWDIRRAYIGKRNCPNVVTEDLDTGFVTLVGAVASVSTLGTETAPKVTWIDEIATPGLVGDFVLHIEVGAGAELRAWGAAGYSVGYGEALDNTNWAIQGVTSRPSTGPFDAYAYDGFSASNLPNILVRCKGLDRQILQPYNFGDSIAQGYGSVDSVWGKSGLMYPWAQAWEALDLPYVPLQLGWQGYSSIMIRTLIGNLRQELGDNPVFLEAATINNWNSGYGIADPGAQNISDLEANITALGQVPYKLWLGFGWEILDATGRGQIRSCYDSIEAAHVSDGMYGNETCGVMDPVTMLFEADMSADGAHPNATAWDLFQASNYAAATAFLATIQY